MACGSGLLVVSKFKLVHELYCYVLLPVNFFGYVSASQLQQYSDSSRNLRLQY